MVGTPAGVRGRLSLVRLGEDARSRSLAYWAAYLAVIAEYRMDAAGKERACKKGKKCGMSCIPQNRNCRAETPSGAKRTNKTSESGREKKEKASGKGSPQKSVRHKKLFTEEEAERYVAGTLWQDRTLYHGTSNDGADSILRGGIRTDKNKRAIYGRGFYLGSNSPESLDDAFTVASSYSMGTVLEAKVRVNKPLRLSNKEYLRMEAQAIGEFYRRGGDDSVSIPDIVSNYMQSKGYDALEIKEYGYVVIFDPKNVAIYRRHDSDGIGPPKPPRDVRAKRQKDLQSMRRFEL